MAMIAMLRRIVPKAMSLHMADCLGLMPVLVLVEWPDAQGRRNFTIEREADLTLLDGNGEVGRDELSALSPLMIVRDFHDSYLRSACAAVYRILSIAIEDARLDVVEGALGAWAHHESQTLEAQSTSARAVAAVRRSPGSLTSVGAACG